MILGRKDLERKSEVVGRSWTRLRSEHRVQPLVARETTEFLKFGNERNRNGLYPEICKACITIGKRMLLKVSSVKHKISANFRKCLLICTIQNSVWEIWTLNPFYRAFMPFPIQTSFTQGANHNIADCSIINEKYVFKLSQWTDSRQNV